MLLLMLGIRESISKLAAIQSDVEIVHEEQTTTARTKKLPPVRKAMRRRPRRFRFGRSSTPMIG